MYAEVTHTFKWAPKGNQVEEVPEGDLVAGATAKTAIDCGYGTELTEEQFLARAAEIAAAGTQTAAQKAVEEQRAIAAKLKEEQEAAEKAAEEAFAKSEQEKVAAAEKAEADKKAAEEAVAAQKKAEAEAAEAEAAAAADDRLALEGDGGADEKGEAEEAPPLTSEKGKGAAPNNKAAKPEQNK